MRLLLNSPKEVKIRYIAYLDIGTVDVVMYVYWENKILNIFGCCNSHKDHRNGVSGERPLINFPEVVKVRLVTHNMNNMNNV